MGYSEEEKHQIICLYYSNNKNISRVQIEYRNIYPGHRVPSTSTVRYTVRQFNEMKSLKRKIRTVVRNEEEDINILIYFHL